MPDGGNPSPVVYRRRLRSELRTARLDAGLTQEQVAAEMDWSLSKVIRIEKGEVNISTNDLKAVLNQYKIENPRRVNELLALARASKRRSWWSSYRPYTSAQFIQYIEYENSAATTRSFQPQLVPGLLQTKEYARAAIRRFSGDHMVEKLLELRMRRQEILDQVSPPQLIFVINEEVIHRGVGGSEVMRQQIRRLLDLADRPNITIEVLPFTAGVYPGMHSPFVILEFSDVVDEDVLFVENPRGDLISRDNPDDVVFYREIFDELQKLSLGTSDSVKYISKLAEHI